MEFEWDEAKCQMNLEKHGLRFADAIWIFDGGARFSWLVQSAPENRFATIAQSDVRFYTAIWTFRNGKIRLISVRGARDEEKREYRSVHS